jgi:hypothetical protein
MSKFQYLPPLHVQGPSGFSHSLAFRLHEAQGGSLNGSLLTHPSQPWDTLFLSSPATLTQASSSRTLCQPSLNEHISTQKRAQESQEGGLLLS